ncbi:hypothetical protein S83_047490, partial [Arachis hypogaea]
ANQEWGNIFPVFKEISITSNALERVLALEIELAETLQAKKKSSMQFQSRIVVILKLIQQSQRLVPDEIQLSQLFAVSGDASTMHTMQELEEEQRQWSSPDLLPLQKKKYKRERKSQSLRSKIPSEDAKFYG